MAGAILLSACGWHGVRVAPPAATPPPTEEPTPRPTNPPSSVVQWSPNPVRRTSTGAQVFSGTVTNTHTLWSAREVALELRLLDGDGNVTETLFGRVADLRPGDKGDYTIAVPREKPFELTNQRLTWKWSLD